MQTIEQIFRKSYNGENIYSMASYNNGAWVYNTEFVPNTINNERSGCKAVVIGNGISRKNFNLNLLVNKKIQTYGCNALYRDFSPDFLIAVGSEITKEIKNSGYADTHVVYSSIESILNYPNTFHHIPQNPKWNAGALAAYLACFDGHSTIYLLGHDGIDTSEFLNNTYINTQCYRTDQLATTDKFWATAMGQVFKTYNLVNFILVNSTGRGYIPEAWTSFTNLRRISYNDFVLECDI